MRARADAWTRARIVSMLVGDAARSMDALQRFDWDGEDALPDDRMWVQLHRSYVLHLYYSSLLTLTIFA